ncbi:MAG: sulfurtransferase [Bryobacterales bacterium]|nr:sulfurtransferase [Bryobacterales bacterium]
MGFRREFVSLLGVILMSIGALAQAIPPLELPGMIVSADWLQGRLDAPSLVILHVGGEADYAAGHVPGAQLLQLADVSVTGETGLRLELPPPEVLAKTLGERGISNQHRVVIYHGTESVQSATRVWFTFDYLGLGKHATLLDGGLALWKREGRPLSTSIPAPTAETLEVRPSPDAVVEVSWLRNQPESASHLLLDARLPQYYSGADPGTMTRAGHIPGAVSVPYPSFFDADGRWKSPSALRPLLHRNGTDPKLVVTYCHIGQQATVPYFAARLLGLEVKLFDGSFQAWSRDAELPVATQP